MRKESQNNPTILDVAKEAGVSSATVSRVLNNSGTVSQKRTDIVNAAIKRLDYYPNSVARSLKVKSTATIAMVVSDISNSFFTSVSRAIEDHIYQHGYNLLVCSTDNSAKKERSYLEMAKEKQIDGLVLNTTNLNDELIASLSKTIPIVLSNRNIKDANFHGDFVDSDNVSGTFDLTKHLIENNHTRIGAICGPQIYSTGYERYQGYIKALKEFNISEETTKELIYYGDFSVNGGFEGMRYLYERANKPTAVVVMNNDMMIGAMRYLRSKSVMVPEEISIVSYGEIYNSDLLYFQPTIVTLNPQIIGQKLAELLFERIQQKNDIINREFRYVPYLQEGKSVRTIDKERKAI